MPDELVIQEAARWLRYAKEDYAAAVMLESARPRHTCLLAQQSAEKAIKAGLALLDERIPKSHDLDMLKGLLPVTWRTRNQFADLSALSFWAVESRYPGDMPEATQDDAVAALALARDVLAVVEQDMRGHGFPE